jgi:hypothetical protein
MIARAVVVLPHPDSPASARTSHGKNITSRASPAPSDSTSENAGGLFARYGIGNLSQYQADFSNLAGTCTVIRFRDDDLPIGYTPPEVTLLDAGNPLRLNGPNASNVAVEQFQGSRIYSKTLYQSGIPGFPGSETGAPTMAAGSSPSSWTPERASEASAGR